MGNIEIEHKDISKLTPKQSLEELSGDVLKEALKVLKGKTFSQILSNAGLTLSTDYSRDTNDNGTFQKKLYLVNDKDSGYYEISGKIDFDETGKVQLNSPGILSLIYELGDTEEKSLILAGLIGNEQLQLKKELVVELDEVEASVREGIDLDHDKDGISTQIEAKDAAGNTNISLDTDSDGLPDRKDTDSDNDGIDDSNEPYLDKNKNPIDEDQDGIPARLDADEKITIADSRNGEKFKKMKKMYETVKNGSMYPTAPAMTAVMRESWGKVLSDLEGIGGGDSTHVDSVLSGSILFGTEGIPCDAHSILQMRNNLSEIAGKGKKKIARREYLARNIAFAEITNSFFHEMKSIAPDAKEDFYKKYLSLSLDAYAEDLVIDPTLPLTNKYSALRTNTGNVDAHGVDNSLRTSAEPLPKAQRREVIKLIKDEKYEEAIDYLKKNATLSSDGDNMYTLSQSGGVISLDGQTDAAVLQLLLQRQNEAKQLKQDNSSEWKKIANDLNKHDLQHLATIGTLKEASNTKKINYQMLKEQLRNTKNMEKDVARWIGYITLSSYEKKVTEKMSKVIDNDGNIDLTQIKNDVDINQILLQAYTLGDALGINRDKMAKYLRQTFRKVGKSWKDRINYFQHTANEQEYARLYHELHEKPLSYDASRVVPPGYPREKASKIPWVRDKHGQLAPDYENMTDPADAFDRFWTQVRNERVDEDTSVMGDTHKSPAYIRGARKLIGIAGKHQGKSFNLFASIQQRLQEDAKKEGKPLSETQAAEKARIELQSMLERSLDLDNLKNMKKTQNKLLGELSAPFNEQEGEKKRALSYAMVREMMRNSGMKGDLSHPKNEPGFYDLITAAYGGTFNQANGAKIRGNPYSKSLHDAIGDLSERHLGSEDAVGGKMKLGEGVLYQNGTFLEGGLRTAAEDIGTLASVAAFGDARYAKQFSTGLKALGTILLVRGGLKLLKMIKGKDGWFSMGTATNLAIAYGVAMYGIPLVTGRTGQDLVRRITKGVDHTDENDRNILKGGLFRDFLFDMEHSDAAEETEVNTTIVSSFFGTMTLQDLMITSKNPNGILTPHGGSSNVVSINKQGYKKFVEDTTNPPTAIRGIQGLYQTLYQEYHNEEDVFTEMSSILSSGFSGLGMNSSSITGYMNDPAVASKTIDEIAEQMRYVTPISLKVGKVLSGAAATEVISTLKNPGTPKNEIENIEKKLDKLDTYTSGLTKKRPYFQRYLLGKRKDVLVKRGYDIADITTIESNIKSNTTRTTIEGEFMKSLLDSTVDESSIETIATDVVTNGLIDGVGSIPSVFIKDHFSSGSIADVKGNVFGFIDSEWSDSTNNNNSAQEAVKTQVTSGDNRLINSGKPASITQNLSSVAYDLSSIDAKYTGKDMFIDLIQVPGATSKVKQLAFTLQNQQGQRVRYTLSDVNSLGNTPFQNKPYVSFCGMIDDQAQTDKIFAMNFVNYDGSDLRKPTPPNTKNIDGFNKKFFTGMVRNLIDGKSSFLLPNDDFSKNTQLTVLNGKHNVVNPGQADVGFKTEILENGPFVGNQ